MQIGELARKAECEVETIRYYEREGLLPAPARSQSGYRQYDVTMLGELQFIRHCRSLGISLAEILHCKPIGRNPSKSAAPSTSCWISTWLGFISRSARCNSWRNNWSSCANVAKPAVRWRIVPSCRG